MNALDALKIAREAMKERRAYCEQWEYKYGKEWDNEDGYIQDAIEKLEAEKPADDYDVSECASDIFSNQDDYDVVKRVIQQYTESYHAKKCTECKEMKKLYVKFRNETPPDECLSCSRQCPNDCPLDKMPESQK